VTFTHLLHPRSKRFFSIYLAELYYTLVQQYRQPLRALFDLFWPILFYLVFAVFFRDNLLAASVQGIPATVYLLAVAGMFGALTVALQGFGQSLALERARGWMRLRRASPTPVTAYFAARLSAVLLLGTALTLGMLLSGIFLVGLNLTLTQALGLVAALLLGVLPFAALALALGYLVAPASAAAVIQWSYYLLLIPMLLGPLTLEALPLVVQLVVQQLPSYHLTQIALGAIGWSQTELWASYLSLGAFTLIALALAVWAYRREEG
jgi:ABC-2 type transport system permease protein